VPRVEVAPAAVEDLDRMIVTYSLPSDTPGRVRHSLRILERFPHVGRELEGIWKSFRFWTGPWSWLLLVYAYDEQQDVVSVVTIQDARSSTAVTNLIAAR
jgi:hypothetical protein